MKQNLISVSDGVTKYKKTCIVYKSGNHKYIFFNTIRMIVDKKRQQQQQQQQQQQHWTFVTLQMHSWNSSFVCH